MRGHLSSRWQDFAFYLALTLCGLGLSGFIGASAMGPRTGTVGTSGDKVEQQQIDLSFLQVGITTREEVQEKLGVMNLGYSSLRLFWFVSKLGYWVLSTPGFTDALRLVRANNVLIFFDENGVVTDKKVIADNKVLWRAITTDLQHAPVRNLSNPTSIKVSTWCGANPMAIALAKDRMEITSKGASYYFHCTVEDFPPLSVPPQDVIRISHGGKYEPRKKFAQVVLHEFPTCHTLYFAEKTVIGRKFHFCTDATNLFTLFQYLYQTHPGGMLWE